MHLHVLDTTRRQQVNRFVRFPFELYADCPQWVPPLLSEARKPLNRARHPFYAHSDAAFFLVESGREVLGRIAVLEHRRFNRIRGERLAFFYLFDCIDDAQASGMLFDAAFSWARDRGLVGIVGPKGFLQADSQGLLVDGFEHRPAVNIAYNYAYYDALVKAAGLWKETDYYSGLITRETGLPKRFLDVADKVSKRRNFRVKSFASKDEMRAWIPRIGHIYNTAFMEHWEFCPVTEQELEMIGERLLAIARPEFIKLVLKDDEVAGFVFAFPDISDGLRKARGRLLPLGWWHIMRAFRTTKHINFNGVGILPPYQGSGANAVMYAELTRTLLQGDYTTGEAVQVEERNLKSLGDMKALGVCWQKVHRIYRGSF
ncbi:MAG: hypothetical protein J7M15_07310 [Anaerolineae bacterium]|nr:hypothetical protein [Anaerolineae bacterium]